LLLVCGALKSVSAAGSGRAFPIDSENYVTSQFQSINPKLEWDPTNFLVDLSGHYANCKYIGQRGPINVDTKTPEGYPITGAVDYTSGSRSDVDAVNGYISEVVDRWMSTGLFNSQIRTASRFGCSVRPGLLDRSPLVVSSAIQDRLMWRNQKNQDTSLEARRPWRSLLSSTEWQSRSLETNGTVHIFWKICLDLRRTAP